MPFAARVNDNHTCPLLNPNPHVGGPIQPPGVGTVIIGGSFAAVQGDVCVCTGGPPDSILIGSKTVLINNKPAARMGDPTAHGGIIIKGCKSVIIGG